MSIPDHSHVVNCFQFCNFDSIKTAKRVEEYVEDCCELLSIL